MRRDTSAPAVSTAACTPVSWPSINSTDRASETAALRRQLGEAVRAARDAYRHTTGLIRLLAVIGQPGSPERLIDDTLTVLSEVFSADMTLVARLLDRRMLVLACCGLPEDDPAFREGWTLDPAQRSRLVRPGRAASPAVPGTEGPVPELFAALGTQAALWQPFGPDSGDDLLVLLRHAHEPFTPVDLEVVGSVAGRLQLAVAERERMAAVEQLVQSGHLLARHLDLDPLLAEAVTLFRGLLAADDTWVTIVEARAEGLTASVRAAAGHSAPVVTASTAESLPGWTVLQHGRPYVDNDGVATGRGRALLGVPVMGETCPQAVLYAARNRYHPFRPDAADLAVVFANYLAVAMTNAALHRALRRSEASLREQATHDPLTGLANRVLAGQRLEEALTNHGNDYVGLLFCDLDGFKLVNDRYGHEAGDHLLQQVASRLRASTRDGDLPARFGGDEFLVVLDGVSGVDEVAALAETVLRSLDSPFAVAGRSVRVSASIGGAVGARGEASASAMLRDADAAMFIAKDRGPGQIEVVPTR